MNAEHGIVATIVAVALFGGAFWLGAASEQADIKRKCEQFGVVDLNLRGAMFYCSREQAKTNPLGGLK